MKRKSFFLICVLFLLVALSVSAAADTGPKPSVRVRFRNMGGGALLRDTAFGEAVYRPVFRGV